MSLLDPASLTEALLVAKGAAEPSLFTGARSRSIGAPRRARPADERVRQSDERARLPLRLDEERHRRLRLATAHLHQSGQALLLAALDHYLDHVVPTLIDGRCHCLSCGEASTGPRRGQGPASTP